MAASFLNRILPEKVRRVAHGARQSAWFARGHSWGRKQASLGGSGTPLAQAPPPGRLQQYFDAHEEGRGIWKWRQYFDAYERHLSKFVGRGATLLEIGIYSGGSLEMWRDYLGPGCRIIGMDIEPSTKCYEGEATEVLIGDQSDGEFWAKFRRDVPDLDIVIDDGGHAPHQQLATLEGLLPHLRPGGVFLCEDIHGINNRFGAYAAGLVQQLNAMHIEPPPGGYVRGTTSPCTPFQKAIHSIHFYPYLLVIEKHPAPVETLFCQRKGTSWQPFGMEVKGIGGVPVSRPS